MREDQERYLESILRNPRDAQESLSYAFRVGGRRYRATELRWFTEGEAHMVLEAAIPTGGVPLRCKGMPVNVDLVFDDRLVLRGFTGEVTRLSVRGGIPKIAAATGGYWLSRQFLQEKTSYIEANPSSVAYDILNKCPYQRIHVPPVREPNFNRVGEDAFSSTASLKDVMDALYEEADLFVLDDARNFAVGYAGEDALEDPKGISLRWEVGVHVIRDTFEYALKNEEDYFDVAVVRRADYDEAGSQGGDVEVLARARVRQLMGGAPPRRATRFEETTDVSSKAKAKAWERAFKLARALSFGTWEVRFTTLLVHPGIQRGSTVALQVRELEPDERGRLRQIDRTWHMMINDFAPDLKNRQVEYVGTGVVAREVPVVPRIGVRRNVLRPAPRERVARSSQDALSGGGASLGPLVGAGTGG